MSNDIFSNHIGGASELTLLADIKPGFVPIPEPITYAARLRVHLRMLSNLRRNGLESDRAGVYVGPIDMLQTLQYVRWTLIENDTKMLLAVNFDRPFEPYVRRIVEIAGPLLDTILCHCEGFDGHSSDQGFDVFMDYAVKHQVPVELFAAAAPNLSVDDGDYYLDMDRKLRGGINLGAIEEDLTKLHIRKPKDRLKDSKENAILALLDQGLNILRVMYENSERFPYQNDITRDDLLYRNLTDRLVPELLENLHILTHGQSAGGDGQEVGTATIQQNKRPNKERIAERVKELVSEFHEPLVWLAEPVEDRKTKRLVEVPPEDAIQPGLMMESIPSANITVQNKQFRTTHACLLLLRVDNPKGGAEFLKSISDEIWPCKDSERSINLSITHSGLKSIGVPEYIRMKFPSAFREGMADRAGLLGDIDCNHPDEWSWPKRNWPLDCPSMQIAPSSIDIIIQIQAGFEDGREDPPFDDCHPLFTDVHALADTASKHDVQLLHVEAMQSRRDKNLVQGHLHFADGISQPDFADDRPEENKMAWDKIKLGDLLLGHPTQRDSETTFPRFDAPLQNGTFQIIRKLRMDVAGLHKQIKDDQSDRPDLGSKTIVEKMVGRHENGSNFETGTKDNAFNFEQDTEGQNTPLQSHIRRANPRSDDIIPPRILRRGFSYGPFAERDLQGDGVDRGLMFIAYNANIAEQFEVIQRWISGGNSTGISSWHGDPILAPRRSNGSRTFRFLHDSEAVTVNLGPKPMATLKWGLYAFTPSRNGLRVFASGEYPEVENDETKSEESTCLEKTILFLQDTDDENRDKRDAFWRNLRKKRKPQDLGDFGVAVGCADQVKAILENEDDCYSVVGYRDRMEKTIGVQYLGLDNREQHATESTVLSAFLNCQLTSTKMFEDTFDVARSYISKLPKEVQSLERDGYEPHALTKKLGRRVRSKDFIHSVTAELSARWFGIPREIFDIGGPVTDEKPHCPRDFLAASYYLFAPHPTDFNKTNAEKRTPAAINALREFIEDKNRQPSSQDTLLGKLEAEEKPAFWTSQKMAEYIAGSCFGLVGPVTGSFRSVFFDWIKEDKLWRLQQQMQEQQSLGSYAAAKKILRPQILRSMSERPIADLLYRQTLKPVTIDGVTIDAGRQVIFSQRSAILDSDDAETFLFGGDYQGSDKAMHKCPGKTMGLAILMSCFAALMHDGTLWPEGPLSVRIKEHK